MKRGKKRNADLVESRGKNKKEKNKGRYRDDVEKKNV